MATLLARTLTRHSGESRYSVDSYLQALTQMMGGGITQTLGGRAEERIETHFEGIVQGAYKANGVIFACMLARLMVFSEARFQYRRMTNGRPGDLFGDPSLRLLERPWRNATTGDLLTRMIQDADLAGNAYIARRRGRLKRMRPDWVTIVLGVEGDVQANPNDLDADLLGYLYEPGGPGGGGESVVLMPDEVAHFAPIPDPAATYRGMSWLTPVIRELEGDNAATDHKARFFTNGATPNMVISFDKDVKPETVKKFKDRMDAQHRGWENAYKTLYLGGGADVKVVGADMKQLDFKLTQGAGETRVAAASGVPPIMVGLSEGLQSATYSNYGQARRRYADGTLRPLWRNAAGSLETLVPPPAGAELWYDDRDIAFLREDRMDSAEIQAKKAVAIRTLVDAGYEAASVVAAVEAEDNNLLVHTGLFSVQLQPPGTTAPADETDPEADPANEGE